MFVIFLPQKSGIRKWNKLKNAYFCKINNYNLTLYWIQNI
jgi:hypothetical protein